MNKNIFAKHPPMGWNSYDYYDTTVNEEQVRQNAAFMAEHLKEYGWEYIVVDIEWYAHKAGSMRDRFQYIPFRSSKWTNIPAFFRIRNVSRPQRTAGDLLLWRNTFTAWG